MIYSKVETRYITSSTNDRLVRYDRIKIDNDTYVVKVWDDQQRGISQPSLITEVATLKFTRDDYNKSFGIGGFPSSVRDNLPPAFEDEIWNKCQAHRSSMQD